MTSPSPPPLDLDRRLRWRFVPIVVFVATLAGLAVVAFGSLSPPPPTVGIPDDPAVRQARNFARGARLPVAPYEAHSEFLSGAASAPPDLAALERAAILLERARSRLPLDARVHAALAAVDLARRRPDRAELGFRRAVDLAGHYPDARIGLGAVLALRADRTPDALERRRLRLRAIAQFYDVRPGDPGESAALANRARVALEVGRRADARAAAERLAAIAPGSPAAAEIARLLAAPAR